MSHGIAMGLLGGKRNGGGCPTMSLGKKTEGRGLAERPRQWAQTTQSARS